MEEKIDPCEESRHVPPLKGLNKENLRDVGKVNKLSISIWY